MKPDLHTHTTASDGLLTPAELVALADKHRVTLLAVTDHDTFDGAAQLLGKPTPMPILQGVELSLRDMPGLHLLGYGRGTDTPLHRKVRALSQMRLGRARQMVEKLNALGYPLARIGEVPWCNNTSLTSLVFTASSSECIYCLFFDNTIFMQEKTGL